MDSFYSAEGEGVSPLHSKRSFHEEGNKSIPGGVCVMSVCTVMDLVAVATRRGELQVYRPLSWTRLWSVVPQTSIDTAAEPPTITSLAWSPDGHTIACGTSSGELFLHEIETGDILYFTKYISGIVTLDWVADYRMPLSFVEKAEKLGREAAENATAPDSVKSVVGCYDLGRRYVELFPPLPMFTDHGGENPSMRLPPNISLEEPEEPPSLDILVVGTETNEIELRAFGTCPVARIDLEKCGFGNSRIIPGNTLMSPDFASISILLSKEVTDGGELKTVWLCVPTPSLAAYRKDILALSVSYSRIRILLGYIEHTMAEMGRVWEDIVSQFGSRLDTFQKHYMVAESSVEFEFLHLLTKGVARPELQEFMIKHLSEGDVKKMWVTVEKSYAAIQRMAADHLNTGVQALLFHASELQGVAEWKAQRGMPGVDGTRWKEFVQTIGTLGLKVTEMMGAVDASRMNYVAFFRWLYQCILVLKDSDEPAAQTGLPPINPIDVAKFLSQPRQPGEHFAAETVKQYFRDQDLNYLAEPYASASLHGVHTNTNTQQLSGLLFVARPEKSLAQLVAASSVALNTAFGHLETTLSQTFTPSHPISLGPDPNVFFEPGQGPIANMCASRIDYSKEERRLITTVAICCNSEAGPNQEIRIFQSNNHVYSGKRTKKPRLMPNFRAVRFHVDNNQNGGFLHQIEDLHFYEKNKLAAIVRRTLPVGEEEEEEEGGRRYLVVISFEEALESAEEISGNFDVDMPLYGDDESSVLGGLETESLEVDQWGPLRVSVSAPRGLSVVLNSSGEVLQLYAMEEEEQEEEEAGEEEAAEEGEEEQ